MGRIRSLKPEFGQNDKLSALPAEVHLFAALLLTFADDEGYFPAHSKLLHAGCCPLRELLMSPHEILRHLQESGYVELFSGTDGREYGKITNFMIHQRVAHPSKSRIKPLCVTPHEILGSPPETLAPDLGSRKGDLGSRILDLGSGGELNSEAPPDHIHSTQFAAKLLEEIRFPKTPGNIRAVAAAIECEVLAGMSKPAAYEFVLAGARDGQDQGMEINTFFFTDAKYRTENRRNGNGGPSKNTERIINNRKAIVAGLGLGADAGPREPDLQNRTPVRRSASVAALTAGENSRNG